MNSREISELRRRFSPDNMNLTCLRGCYVNSKKEIVSLFRLPPVSLPEEERADYLALLRKVLGGTPGKNLVTLSFATADVGVSDEHRLLTALRDDALQDDDLAQVFFQRVIDGLEIGEGCLILLSHDAYDVPFRGEGGGDEVFRFLTCAVCPVKLSRAALAYSAGDNLFHPCEPQWLVGAPEAGFVFPAFDGRASNIYNALCYTRDTAGGHDALLRAVFGAQPPMPADAQASAFREILQDTLGEECSLEVVQSVHEQVCERLEEQRRDRGAPPPAISAPALRQALEVCGVPQEKAQAFEQRCRESLGGEADASAVNLLDARQFQVRAPGVVIRVDPDHRDLVETRVINGRRYILIRADEGVEVNGVSVSIRP